MLNVFFRREKTDSKSGLNLGRWMIMYFTQKQVQSSTVTIPEIVQKKVGKWCYMMLPSLKLTFAPEK